MKYIESHSYDPHYNLAFEEYIFKYLPLDDGGYVTLWQNGPAVIIGKNQNAWAEINEKYLEEHDVKLIRRITGGGAVYHDLGNLNFSFITKDKVQGKIDFKLYYEPIVAALRALGAPAELSGRNDITVDEKKVVGASQSIWGGRVLSNGCILFDVKMENLAQALTVRPEKLKSKGVSSVRARVSNIKPYVGEDKTVEEFKQLLLREIFKAFGEEPVEYVLTEEDKKGIEKIRAERFGLRSWNWGKSPKGTHKKAIKFPYGFVELSFDIVGGKIQDMEIQGDFFGTEDVTEIANALSGVDYERKAVLAAIRSFAPAPYFGAGATHDDLIDLMFGE